MDDSALQEWCRTLTLRLEDAERRAQRMEDQWLLERTRNEVWQLKEDKRQLEHELSMVRKFNHAGAPTPRGLALQQQVQQQEGRCLACNSRAALYCDAHCATADAPAVPHGEDPG